MAARRIAQETLDAVLQEKAKRFHTNPSGEVIPETVPFKAQGKWKWMWKGGVAWAQGWSFSTWTVTQTAGILVCSLLCSFTCEPQSCADRRAARPWNHLREAKVGHPSNLVPQENPEIEACWDKKEEEKKKKEHGGAG